VTDALATSSAAPDASSASARARAVAYLAERHRLQIWEALPWGLALAAFWLFPDRLTFGSQVLVMVLFALSLDLILALPASSPSARPPISASAPTRSGCSPPT